MNTTLLELFRQESETQTNVLDAGLLVLEREPQQAAQLEACMRAAHSLKGAARVVGVGAGVCVAHAMEDVFVAAQNDRIRLERAHIDALLEAADQMRRLGDQPTAVGEGDVAALVKRLEALLPVEDVARELPAPVPQSVPEPLPEVEASGEPAEAGSEGWIRISADRINDLLDASGKAVIGSQRLSGLGSELQRIKRQQGRVRLALEALQDQTPRAFEGARAQALLADLREQMQESVRQLDAHLAAFDAFTWHNARRIQTVHNAALASRMRPFSDLLQGRDRMVRDLARALGKRVRVTVEGRTTLVDREVLDRLDAPLTHLLRNAIDHGIESPAVRVAKGKPEEGEILLRARHQAGQLVLDIVDDGAGIDLGVLQSEVVHRRFASAATAAHLSESELLAFLFLPGFTMRDRVTDVSGRGVGLDAVHHDLRRIRGNVRVESQAGKGCTFRLEVPLTLSMVRSLVVTIGGEAYAFPLGQIERMLCLEASQLVELEGRQHFWHEGRHVGLVSAAQMMQLTPGPSSGNAVPVVVVRDAEGLHGIVVEGFIGEQTLALVPLDARFGKIRDVAAGALLDDGAPVLIIDVDDLVASIGKTLGEGHVEALGRAVEVPDGARPPRILVVEDSLTVRELQRKLLLGQGYEVEVAVDGMDGWNTLRAGGFDLLITDIDMPRMDGIELVQLLRRETRFASLPVMILSYKDREEDRLRGLDAGADYYLAKSSFQDEGLLQAVRMLLGREEA